LKLRVDVENTVALSAVQALIAHTETASWHFCPCSSGIEDRVHAFGFELGFVHAGGGTNPQLGGNCGFAVEDFGGGAVVSDVGHAGADEDFINFSSGDFAQEFDIVGVVGGGDDQYRGGASDSARSG
jgi:hypothetical protein